MQTPRASGLGLALVAAFAQQLGGTADRDEVEKGTRTRVSFPLPI
jgi:signal transduction histidine kinase